MDKTQQRERSNPKYLQDVRLEREELFKAELQASMESIILFNDDYSLLLLHDKWLRLFHCRIWSHSCFSVGALGKYFSRSLLQRYGFV